MSRTSPAVRVRPKRRNTDRDVKLLNKNHTVAEFHCMYLYKQYILEEQKNDYP